MAATDIVKQRTPSSNTKRKSTSLNIMELKKKTKEEVALEVAYIMLPELRLLSPLINARLALQKHVIKPLTMVLTGCLAIVAAFKLSGLQLGEGFDGLGNQRSGQSSGKTSEQGIKDILNYEGFRSEAYKDSGGVWTIGYGHTGGVKPGQTITQQEAYELFKKDLAKFEKVVNDNVKVPISQNMFDALVSFCYNVGPGNFKKSTLLKKLNEGDYQGAAAEFANWTKDRKGNVLKGLQVRRAKEAAKFSVDISSDNKLQGEPVPNTFGQKGGTIGGFTLKDGTTVSNIGKTFLEQTKGTGIVTAGTNGAHEKSSTGRGHAEGYKIDIVPISKTTQGWGDLICNLLDNPRTEVINLEVGSRCFSTQEADDILNYVKGKGYNTSKVRKINQTKNSNGRHLDVKYTGDTISSTNNNNNYVATNNVKPALLPDSDDVDNVQQQFEPATIAYQPTSTNIQQRDVSSFILPKTDTIDTIETLRNTVV